MGTWQLLCNEEVVDTVDLKTNIYEEAHTYFRLRKNLKPEDFTYANNNNLTTRNYLKNC